MEQKFKAYSLILGSLLTAAGFTLAGINAFRSRPELVFTGFIFFVTGYKIQWYGTNRLDSLEELRRLYRDADFGSHLRQNISNYFLIALGVASASYGTTIFTELVSGFSMYAAIASGVLCILGYMLAHEGVNEVLL